MSLEFSETISDSQREREIASKPEVVKTYWVVWSEKYKCQIGDEHGSLHSAMWFLQNCTVPKERKHCQIMRFELTRTREEG